MSEKSEEHDGVRSASVEERASVLRDGLGLDDDAARSAARDRADDSASRKPASDDVDNERVARANAEKKKGDG